MSNTTLDTITANITLMEARLQRAHSLASDALAAIKDGKQNLAMGTLLPMQEDMAEIDRSLARIQGAVPSNIEDAKVIAARYRVEADPLVEALVEALQTTGRPDGYDSVEGFAADLRTELAKRGLTIGDAR